MPSAIHLCLISSSWSCSRSLQRFTVRGLTGWETDRRTDKPEDNAVTPNLWMTSPHLKLLNPSTTWIQRKKILTITCFPPRVPDPSQTNKNDEWSHREWSSTRLFSHPDPQTDRQTETHEEWGHINVKETEACVDWRICLKPSVHLNIKTPLSLYFII